MITVAIVDDEPLIRLIAAVIDAHPDLSVVGQADGDEAAALVQRTRPGVLLMDLRMTRLSGIEATRAVCAADPAPPVLMLTTFDGDPDVLDALRAGASGYVLKRNPDQLPPAIRHVHAGEVARPGRGLPRAGRPGCPAQARPARRAGGPADRTRA